MTRVPLLLWLFVLVAACSPREPRWVQLAQGYRPAPLLPLVQRWQSEAGLEPATLVERLNGLEVRMPLAPAAWRRVDERTWRAPLPGGAFAHGLPGFLRLSSPAGDFRLAPEDAPPPPGSFRLEAGELVLTLPSGREPPELVLEQRMEQGRATEEGQWQLRLGSDYASGIPVWAGQASTLRFDLPPASRLTFRAQLLSRAPAGELHLRLALDGEELFTARAPASDFVAGREFACELPRKGRAGTQLEITFTGPPGCLALVNPCLAPVEIGSYAARPWPRTQPDIVVPLADTFRADNLALYGGDPSWTPNLARFAQDALVCTDARSNAAWTLPSISSLLSGYAPGQHTANDVGFLLPDRLVTLAERLARAGYRTGAITDAAFFAPHFGLDQGFELFQTNGSDTWDLDWTVARAREFLAQDDGRPLFLVVHSYRAHMPFRVGPDEDRSAYDALHAEGYTLLEKKDELSKEAWRALLDEAGPRFAALYREGVKDLDRGFGLVLDELERRGILEQGVVLFTSDHGEALGENDDFYHGGELWDAKLRIPLVLRAPGVAARRLEHSVTLLDVTPTLCALAGLPADPLWLGSDLRTLASARPALAFRLQKETQLALVEGAKKLLARDLEALENGLFDTAFDLAQDPREETPLDGPAWAAELARRNARLVRQARSEVVEPAPALLQPEIEKGLKDIGY